MTTFFQNNFTQDKWKKSALKNAFALLGKQRFAHAAAFFLLAGNVTDAVEVCLNKLDDLQLALVIVRCYESDLETNICTPNYLKLLYQEILGRDEDGSNYSPSSCHPDPFLRSMAYWMVKDTEEALNTLLESELGQSHPKATEDDSKYQSKDIIANPSVFNFYLFLRTHPLVARRYLVQSMQAKRDRPPLLGHVKNVNSTDLRVKNQNFFQDVISPLERRLFFTTAHCHFRAGCPALALEVLSRLPNHVALDSGSSVGTTPDSCCKVLPTITVGDQSHKMTKPEPPKQSAADFDWGAPVTRFEEPTLDLNLGNSSEEEDESGGLQMKEPEATTEEEGSEEKGKLDIMAQQLKFIACLKIMMEELSTLATGFEVDGAQLRYQLYIWLEKSVFALRELCNYSNGQALSSSTEAIGETFEDMSTSFEEKANFETKMQRASRRKHWLKANEALLRTLLSYCSLHGAHGGGLATVRMELILLVQELHQDIMSRQLLTPLPFPYALPLLGASVAFQKTVVADPIRHLQTRQTTLDAGKDKDLHDLILALSTKIDDFGIKMETRLDSVEQGLDQINQRLQHFESSLEATSKAVSLNTNRISDLERRLELEEMRKREKNLIIYGMEGAEGETPEESRGLIQDLISNTMQISEDLRIEQCRRLTKRSNSPLLIEALTHDILLSLLDMRAVATTQQYTQVVVLRDLSTSLSACILQSLSDGNTFRPGQTSSRGLDLATFIR
ncbi:DMXL1 [Cordylochernes scorpioides]|uniref:DMXL1 n=1 Tax=Cordylochernes scorpioides TaxID=51811 RepID=A0ABY6KTQ0_9ARAC|nr:DMXL1 [Cordylochernes scorpioides]